MENENWKIISRKFTRLIFFNCLKLSHENEKVYLCENIFCNRLVIGHSQKWHPRLINQAIAIPTFINIWYQKMSINLSLIYFAQKHHSIMVYYHMNMGVHIEQLASSVINVNIKTISQCFKSNKNYNKIEINDF